MKNFIFFLLAFGMFFSCEKQNFWNLKKLGEVGSVSVNTNNLASISISADFIHDGHDDVKRIGFVWSDINNLPTLADNFSENDIVENKINATINWTVNTQLYVRSYIENSIGVYYSEPTKINWTGDATNLPSVFTINPNQFSFFELTINGNILSDGGIPISEQGFCYSQTSASPTIANTVVVNTSGSASFSEFLSNLNENTTYYLRSYAKNLQGISYGNAVTITTKNYYYVGETGPQGGIIFFSKIDTLGGWNFLEAAASDVSSSLPWAFNSNSISTSYGLGSGKDNTSNIIQQFGTSNPNYAALAARNYSSVTGSNWCLPSRDELIKMKEVLFLNGMGNFSVDATYWSSSQDPNFNMNAWTVKMSTGIANPSTYGKNTLFRIRPIRRF
jgi:hypothetical protein